MVLPYICAMQPILDSINALYKKWKGKEAVSLDVLPQSGSERRYFRLHGESDSVIGTYGANIKENESFIYFSEHFAAKKLCTPIILAISDDRMFYLQEDFGDTSLLNKLEAQGFVDPVYELFKKALKSWRDCR